MNWSELKRLIDEAIHESGLDPSQIEVWYIDQEAISGHRKPKVHIGDPHHAGFWELWVN